MRSTIFEVEAENEEAKGEAGLLSFAGSEQEFAQFKEAHAPQKACAAAGERA